MLSDNTWQQVLTHLRVELIEEDFRRWFSATAYAGDSGDQITVWVPSEAVRQHLSRHFLDRIDRALDAMGRSGTRVRFVVADPEYDEEDDDTGI